ncbi:MAG: ExbD/TolR family protein [Fibrobacterota bacterium]
MSHPVSRVRKIKAKKSKQSRGGAMEAPKLQLTSLIDIMTVLLVFLIKSFSAEGEIVTMTEGLVLPSSTATEKGKLATNVSVTKKSILVEGVEVASSKEAIESSEYIIPELASALSKRRALTRQIAENSTSMEFTGDIVIQADKKIKFRLLQKIIYTAGQEEFNNFSLAVIKKQ